MRKPKPLRPYRLLRLELGRLRRLYDGCLYSFSVTTAYLDSGLKAETILGNTKIVVPDTDRVVAWSPYELLERMKRTHPEMLRASLLVRAVSYMENYLVDLLKEVASRSLAPFKLQDKMVSFSQAQLLSFDSSESLRSHLIQIECRALNGKGFKEFEKFYKKRLNISFSQGPVPVDEVDGIYARRHLLVHAGGIIDRQFHKKYAPDSHPGQALEISDEYFQEALRSLDALAAYCASRIETLFPKDVESAAMPTAQIVDEYRSKLSSMVQKVDLGSILLIKWFEAVFRTKELLDAHFTDQSTFLIEETEHRLSSILVGTKRINERKMQWLVCGDKELVGPYIAYLKYMSRRGLLEEFDLRAVPHAAALSNLHERNQTTMHLASSR